MRRILTLALLVASAPWLLAQSKPAPAPPAAMLTVDSIMRGPKLVGSAPSAVRWSKDSSKIYFSWQKAGRRSRGHLRRQSRWIRVATAERRGSARDRGAARRTIRSRPQALARDRRRRPRHLRQRDRRTPAAHAHGRCREQRAMGTERHRGHVRARRQSVSSCRSTPRQRPPSSSSSPTCCRAIRRPWRRSRSSGARCGRTRRRRTRRRDRDPRLGHRLAALPARRREAA